jgi:UDP-N-acetylmuramoyl-tripeptide--D-alanyl-D-alanine ligase
MPVVPKHMAINFAAALAVVYCLGLDINQAVKALAHFKLQIGRGLVVDVKKEGKKYSIITDYYNASPESLKASLAYLHQFKNPKKSVVLGDMKELGKEELKFHLALLPHIVKSGIKKLFLVGNVMPEIAKEIPENILVYTYKTSEELAFNINKYIEGEEIILIKGSRSIHLEKVAEALGVTNAL